MPSLQKDMDKICTKDIIINTQDMHTKYIYSPPPPQRNKANAAPTPVSRVGSAAMLLIDDIMSRFCRAVAYSMQQAYD